MTDIRKVVDDPEFLMTIAAFFKKHSTKQIGCVVVLAEQNSVGGYHLEIASNLVEDVIVRVLARTIEKVDADAPDRVFTPPAPS